MSGYVYVGFDSSGLFKIGISNDLKKRMRQYKTTNPNFQYLCDMRVDSPAIVEAELHAKFGESRVHGEWFNLSGVDLKWIHQKFYGTSVEVEKYTELIRIIKHENFARYISNPENILELKKEGYDTSILEAWR